MKWLSLSRARYTFPNFPLPRGRPISKSSIVSCRLTGEEKKASVWKGGGGRESGTPNARLPLPLSSPSAPFSFQGPGQGVWSAALSPMSQHFTHTACSSPLHPTSLPLPDTTPKALTSWARRGEFGLLQLLKNKELSTFSFVSSPIPHKWHQAFFLNPLSLVLVLVPLTRGLSTVGLHHSL